MRCHEFGALGIKMDDTIDTDIDFREVVFVVIAVAQHFSALQDVLFFEFAFRTEDVESGVEFTVLRGDGACLGFVLHREFIDIAFEVVDLLSLFGDLDVFLRQLGSQILGLLVEVGELRIEGGDGGLHGGTQFRVVGLRRLDLLAKIGYQFVVEFEGAANELHVLDDGFAVVLFALATLHADTALCLVDLTKTFLDFVERGDHVIEFRVFLVDDLLQRIGRRGGCGGFLLLFGFTGGEKAYPEEGNQQDHNFIHGAVV